VIERLRAWVAAQLIRLALRCDPGMPLAGLAVTTGADLQRGMGKNWVLFLTFRDYHCASSLQSWILNLSD